MKKIYTPTYLLLAILFFLFTACEKEQIKTETIVPINKAELAKRYLEDSPTLVTFAVLEMDHNTNSVSGFVMDKESNIRAINLEEVSFLGLDEVNMSNYFTKLMFEKSEVIEEVDVEIMAENVKQSRRLKGQDTYVQDESTETTSKLYLSFNPNTNSSTHTDCIDNENWGTAETYVNKVVLSARGQYTYDPTTETEIALVSWLNSFETTSSDTN